MTRPVAQAAERSTAAAADRAPGPAPGAAAAAALRRQVRLLGCACLAALALAATLTIAMRSRAVQLLEHTQRVARLADDAATLLRLRALESTTTDATASAPTDFLRQVEDAMTAAGLDPGALVRCAPRAGQRSGASNDPHGGYRLIFRDVELAVLLRFVFELTAGAAPCDCAGLRLQAGNRRATWNAEIDLTQRRDHERVAGDRAVGGGAARSGTGP